MQRWESERDKDQPWNAVAASKHISDGKVCSRGFIEVDRVSRTSAPGVYAAGDCTGVQMLASVAAMQGRIAMWHALGEAVQPIRLSHVAATIFTDPEIASVGVSQAAVDRGEVPVRVVKQPLGATNPRAKMAGIRDGFVKIFARPGNGLWLSEALQTIAFKLLFKSMKICQAKCSRGGRKCPLCSFQIQSTPPSRLCFHHLADLSQSMPVMA